MRSTLPTFNEVWQQQFRACLLKQSTHFSEDTTFLIGCSGGMDSMLLLYLMSEIFPQRIRAIYVNHQLQTVSGEWADFIANQCQILKIPYVIENVDVAAGNIENEARNARYKAYLKHIQSHEVLVLAHHQQDQAETVLLRLLSGTGVQGLSAMKIVDERPDFKIWRPLLKLIREQICQWVMQWQIPYVDDPTNLDTTYDRAWCRHELWHILQSRFPQMQQALSRTSYLMQDADEILQEIVTQDLATCGNAQALNIHQLKQLSKPRQRQLISHWMRGHHTYRPAFDMVERLFSEVIEAKADAKAALHWNGYYYVRFQQVIYRLESAIYLASTSHMDVTILRQFHLNQDIELASGCYQIETAEIGLNFALLNRDLNLSRRQGGEKIHLYGRVGSWPLKKAIQEAQIFPWTRHTIQILSIDNVMLGVFTPKGFWLAQSEYCEVGGWLPKLISSL